MEVSCDEELKGISFQYVIYDGYVGGEGKGREGEGLIMSATHFITHPIYLYQILATLTRHALFRPTLLKVAV